MPFLSQPLSIADRVDSVFLFIFVLCVAFLVFITTLMIYFVVRYSRHRNPTPVDIPGNTWLEITWTLIPLGLFLVMFYYGWTNFAYMRNPPRDAMVVEVTARQWAWSFKYPNGKQTDEMYVAVNRPVKVELHSTDVLHGFYIPAFRVKEDVVPGKTNYLWFQPTSTGTFDIQCTVMCGINHSYMLSKVHVLPEEQFRTWYFADEKARRPGGPGKAPAATARAATTAAASVAKAGGGAAAGLALVTGKGCATCHSSDGTRRVGPSFKKLFGSTQTVLENGSEAQVTADETYLEKAIRQPSAQIVKGYPPAMPSVLVTDRELADIVSYIKSLR